MKDAYTALFLLVLTFLLICWVVARYQTYMNEYSLQDEIRKPRVSSRAKIWQTAFMDTLHNAKYFKQEKLRSENRATFLFGSGKKDRKKKIE